MDNIAQKIANALSSAFVIIPFGLWTIYHLATTKEYVSFISDMAILIGLLILRDEKVAAETTEKNVKADLRLSRKVIKLIKRGQEYER